MNNKPHHRLYIVLGTEASKVLYRTIYRIYHEQKIYIFPIDHKIKVQYCTGLCINKPQIILCNRLSISASKVLESNIYSVYHQNKTQVFTKFYEKTGRYWR